MTDYGPIFDPPKEYSPRAEAAIDSLSWGLPALSAGLSVWAGIEALKHVDDYAATFGIAGAVIGAFGVLFTNLASRVRDRRLAEIKAGGEIISESVERIYRMAPPHF